MLSSISRSSDLNRLLAARPVDLTSVTSQRNNNTMANARAADRRSVPGYSGESSFEPASNTARTAAATTAESQLTYPGQLVRRGAEGEDVKAIQQKLKDAGYDVGEIDGKFGPKTERALKQYQRDQGLKADGVAGPKTYDSFNGVKSEDGTKAADGTESVNADKSVKGPVDTQLPDSGEGFTTYGPRNMQYGTEQTVKNLEEIAARYKERTGKTLEIGDISKEGGGKTDRHQTHINGTDVDMRPPSKNGGPSNWRNADYDRDATRALIEEIKRTNPNAKILFNDPVLIAEGLCSPAKGHDNHLHVSFK